MSYYLGHDHTNIQLAHKRFVISVGVVKFANNLGAIEQGQVQIQQRFLVKTQPLPLLRNFQQFQPKVSSHPYF